MVDQGHAVFATEKDPAMLAVLQERVPEVSAKVAGAEEIPANDRSVDVVIAAQAFHWFDHERGAPGDRARAQARRPRRPRLELLRQAHPVGAQAHRRDGRATARDDLARRRSSPASDLFEDVERKTFAFWQDVTRDTLVDIVASRSYIASLPEDEREAKLDAVRALYDDYGRGHDGMQLPYVVECFRAKVIDQRDAATEVPADASQEGPIVSDGTDTDMLLIDFR